MDYRLERILYIKTKKFTDKYQLSSSYSIRNLLSKLKIKLIPYQGLDIKPLMAISEDAFSVIQRGKRYIFYNPFQNEYRKNFSFAHELGHFVLEHHKITKHPILANGDKGIIETQANIFARNFLMPAEEVEELLEVKTVKELAEKYEVSRQMAQIRVDNLHYDLKWLNHVESKIFKQK